MILYADVMEKFEKTVDNGGVSQIMTKVVTISVPAVIKTITVTGSVIICFISVVYLSVVIDNVRDWKKENVFRMEIKAVSDSLYRLIQVYFKIEALILVINSILCIIALLNNKKSVCSCAWHTYRYCGYASRFRNRNSSSSVGII